MTPFRLLVALLALSVVSGCQSKAPSPMDEPLIARFFIEVRPGTPGMTVQLPVSRTVLNINPKPVLVETDIANVEFTKVDLGWCLFFQFKPAAARDLYRLRSEEHTSELQSHVNLVCRLLLEKKKKTATL